MASAFPPLCSIALVTAAAAPASFAYVMATLAPSAAKRFAIAAPIPREPPVTRAILPSSLFDTVSSPDVGIWNRMQSHRHRQLHESAASAGWIRAAFSAFACFSASDRWDNETCLLFGSTCARESPPNIAAKSGTWYIGQ